MQLEFHQKLLAKYKELTTAVDAFDGSIGEDDGHRIVATLKIDDPYLTPSVRDARMVQAGEMTAQIKDPVQRKAAESVVSSAYNSAQQFFTRPAQAEAERNVVFSYDKDPATEIKYIQGLVRSGLMAPEAGNRVIANYRSLQQADMRPMVDASRNAVNLAMEAEINLVKLITSEGGTTITKRESQFLIERKAELTGSVEAMRRKALADGSGVAGYKAQLDAFTKALLPQAAKPINPNLTPTFKSPEQWKQTVNPVGRGRQQDNDRLRQQVDNGRVMTEPEFNKNFTAWVERGEMSDAMKLMIKHSGYGAKPSEFWRKQWSNQYNGAPMDPKYEQAIPLRDQMKVSYQPDTSGPSTQLASNLSSFWQNLANASMNAVMPPAAAATMPTETMGQVKLGAPVVGTPKLNANAKAWLAAISAKEFEGAGYNTYYGGGVFDNTKGHPMRVVRPEGGIASSAAGRYQFMPDTWTGLHGGKNPPMTPANQDAGAYRLALARGVDINTAPPTIENVRKLAPEWAALPVRATGGAGHYKGQGGAGYSRFRQTWNTERNRY
jgi:muramidase (phage lysozyme)